MNRANQLWIRYGCYLKAKPNELAKISESRGKEPACGSSLRGGPSAHPRRRRVSPAGAGRPPTRVVTGGHSEAHRRHGRT